MNSITASAAGTALDLAGYHLTFDDEFNSFSSSPYGSATQWATTAFEVRTLPTNEEQEYYSDLSVGVSPFDDGSGSLTITAQPGTNPLGLPYVSGVINSRSMFSQPTGYFEIRTELPAGPGMWPAFWLMPEQYGSPGEIDAMEAFGAPAPDGEGGTTCYHWAVHAPDAAESAGAWLPTGADITAGYHGYGVDLEADYITDYFDGEEVAKVATPAGIGTRPFYMIANLAVGGPWCGNPVGEAAQMKIDYIRAYSRDISTPEVKPQAGYSESGTTFGATVMPESTTMSITLRVSEDAYLGDVQFIVRVDGTRIGDTMTASALHSCGDSNVVELTGNWGDGLHQVAIQFLNDAYGGSPGADRNLYIDSIAYNHQTISGTTAVLAESGTRSLTVSSAASTAGEVGDTVSLHLSGDAYDGRAQFKLLLDGEAVTTAQDVVASHADGVWQNLSFAANLCAGGHIIGVQFTNDAYGGSAVRDRNLYVAGVDVNGIHYGLGVTALYTDGTAAFAVVTTH